MTINEKQELIKLLTLYMGEMVSCNNDNVRQVKNHGGRRYDADIKSGVKSQYEHARVLATRLAVEVGNEIKSYWEL